MYRVQSSTSNLFSLRKQLRLVFAVHVKRRLLDPARPGKIRWLLVAWLTIIGAVSYLDRVNISIAAPSIAREFHLDNLQLGWIFSAFALGYAVFQIPGGWLADRYGPRRVLALGAVWWALFTAATAAVPPGLTQALMVFLAVRLLLGMGESVMYPCSNHWVAHWIPNRERGLANGWIFAGVGAGAALTPPLIAWIMSHWGWRFSFWSCSLVGLAAAAVWYWMARDRPQEQPWVRPEETALIHDGIAPVAHGERKGAARLGRWSVWGLTASYFCYGYVAYIFFTWFFLYLVRVRGLDLKSSSFYAMLPFAAMSSCSALGGWISDRVTRRKGGYAGRCGVAAAAMLAAAIFVALGSLTHSAGMASLILAGGAGALYLSQSSYWALSADLGGPSSGLVSGLMNTGAQTGSAITASLTPLLAEHFGWTASFLVAAGFCLLGAILWLTIHPEAPMPAPSAPGLQLDSASSR